MPFRKSDRRRSAKADFGRRLGLECLEDRRMLAIIWANELGTGADDPHFNNYFANEAVARQIVDRAINDWNTIITDQNFDNDNNPATNNFALKIFEGTLATGGRGQTSVTQTTTGGTGQTGWTIGVPMAASITLDDNGGGDGWFFDQTPLDDAEFTGIVNSGAAGTGAAFEASFVDVSTNNLNYNDFYRTITHEIGHALGIRLVDTTFGLNSGNWLIQNQTTLQTYSLPTDTTDDGLGQLTYVGYDQVTPTRTVFLFDPNTSRIDPFTVVNELWQYQIPGGAAVTFTEDGGGHLYEGNVNDPVGLVVHPNELMNSGRSVPPPGGNPIPTVRQFISDLDIQLLADAYGYNVTLPSTRDTANVTLDYQTGTLLVQGRTGGQNDTITIDTVGSNIRVVVNGTTELVPTAQVSQIIIAKNGGTDTQTVTGISVPVTNVDYVVSSNQDSASAGTPGDGIVDLDVSVPGNQVCAASGDRRYERRHTGSFHLCAARQLQAHDRGDRRRYAGRPRYFEERHHHRNGCRRNNYRW